MKDIIKRILREEVKRRYDKPSPDVDKLVYGWLDKYMLNSQMYQEKTWESRTDFTWCKGGKEIMNLILFFDTDETIYNDDRPVEVRSLEESTIHIPKNIFNSILTYFPIRPNYLKFLIEEWFEDNFISKINSAMGRNDITIHKFDTYPDTARVCVPPMTKPDDVTEEEMIDYVCDTTLYRRDELIKREEEEPGFIEKVYLQKIRQKKREDLEGPSF